MREPSGNTDTALRRLLSREVLLSERRRMLGLAALLTLILAMILTVAALAPDIIASMFHGRIPVHIALGAFLPFIAYEFVAAGIMTFLLRRGRGYPTFGRYANAFIETSFPTLLLYLLSIHIAAPTVFSAWTVMLYFLFIILSTLRLDFALSAFTGAVAAVELYALVAATLPLVWEADDLILTIPYHLSRSGVLLAAGILAGYVGVTIRRHFERALAAASARDQVTNLFGQHVSPQVVERLLAIGPTELSEMRRVCVMFVDIRSFTEAARSRTPAEVVARLDDAFAIMVEIIDRHQGIVNKFLGDGLLAIFGAPIEDSLAAANAVAAAREILRAIGASNVGNAWPIRIGIGIHVGEAVAGTMGSPRRKEYTVIGDTVNLASRLESLNKEVGSQLLVSAAVHEAAGNAIGDGLPLGNVAIRGYAEPVAVWRLA